MTTTDTSNEHIDISVGNGPKQYTVGDLHVLTGCIRFYGDDCEVELDADAALALSEFLREHQVTIHEAARAKQAQTRWDDAYCIIRDLVGRGVPIYQVERDFNNDDVPGALRISLHTADDVRANAAGVEVTQTERDGYLTTRAEVLPGVTLHDVTRVADVAEAVTA